MPKKKYLSCKELESSLFLAPDELRSCCQRFFRDGKMRYCQEPVENYDYEDQPHEIEAREWETMLYDRYLIDKQGVPASTPSTNFGNRLRAPV